MKRIAHSTVKKLLLADPDVLAEYNELEEEFKLISQMIHARRNAGLTQKEVAQEMGTSKSFVSRLESLNLKSKNSPTLRSLRRYAATLNCNLFIKLVPKKT